MDNHHIWEVLLSNGTITHDQLSDALRWQRSHPDEDVGSILLARGIVTDGQLLAAYAQRLDVPFIEKDLVVKRPEVLKLVPETLARRYGIMPLDINNNKILVAISDPEDMSVIEDVKLSSRMDASIALASAENIQGAIERYYRNAELFYREEQEEVQTVNFVSDDTAKKMDEIESSVNNTPVVKLVNNLVQQAYIRQASDIHIEPFENDVIVRMRIDGDLIEVMRLAPNTLARRERFSFFSAAAEALFALSASRINVSWAFTGAPSWLFFLYVPSLSICLAFTLSDSMTFRSCMRRLLIPSS